MPTDLLIMAVVLWLVAAFIAAFRRGLMLARLLLGVGAAATVAATVLALPLGTPPALLPFGIVGEPIAFALSPPALWLMGFGMVPAALACWLSTPARQEAGWLFGAATSLVGALGVFGLQHGIGFLIAWELMSLGGGVMILTEALAPRGGRPVLFMLGLLEAGAVALLLAVLLLGVVAQSVSFDAFQNVPGLLSSAVGLVIGLLFLVGFGAKLGLVPFYEWFPAAYGAGSGATGTIMSGVVLNAAFFGLSRALLDWIPGTSTSGTFALGAIVVAVGVLSAILAILHAFQQEDWRALLSLSSAENASIAVAALGAALMFRYDGLTELSGLAWIVALLHLAGHSLAKGALFLTADGVYRVERSYSIFQSALLKRSSLFFGLGALFAVMSLSAMPPQAGFVSEWFIFQTVFQSFHLSSLGGRLVLSIAGAGLALTAAIGFATFVKVLGVGLLGRSEATTRIPRGPALAVGILGFGVLALAVGMPVWLDALAGAAPFGGEVPAATQMHDGWLLVPLTAKFAFISPSMLIIAMPLLALLPILLVLSTKRLPIRRAPVWYGGFSQDPAHASTTALTFSNALRTFYSFIYRPTAEITREVSGRAYFIKELAFSHDVSMIFTRYLFSPLTKLVNGLARRLRVLQSGHLNVYLALIGLLLVIILALTFY